jgi:nucleoside phosphorylase
LISKSGSYNNNNNNQYNKRIAAALQSKCYASHLDAVYVGRDGTLSSELSKAMITVSRTMASSSLPRHRNDFEIAIICALPLEADAVEALFEKRWDVKYGKAGGDPNVYTTGVIGNHNVVLAYMPGIGKGSAASVASSFRSSFGGIKLALVVGICGGVPNGTDGEEILLGDVIISDGIIGYDFGRRLPDKFVRKDTLMESPGRPNTEIRALLNKLKGLWGRNCLQDSTSCYLAVLREVLGHKKTRRPDAVKDKLFEPMYRHMHHNIQDCKICTGDQVCQAARDSTCQELECDERHLVPRRRLATAVQAAGAGEDADAQKPAIHFGLIASGDTVMKSGEDRDEIATRERVIAFEMEGAGVWDNLPCVVIKGVCDYADSHKNKEWQSYAAATAAACVKAFLEHWTITDKALPLTAPEGM